MKLLIMFYISLAVMLFASCVKDWIEGLDERIAMDEYFDDIEDMLYARDQIVDDVPGLTLNELRYDRSAWIW